MSTEPDILLRYLEAWLQVRLINLEPEESVRFCQQAIEMLQKIEACSKLQEGMVDCE